MASNWHRTAIGNHIDLLTGFPFGSQYYTEDTVDVRLLRGDNVIQGTIRWEDVKRWPVSQTANLERYQLAENDIVIAMDRTWVKAGLKIAQIKNKDIPSLLVQRVARLRAKGELDQDYLAQCINGYRFEQYVKGSQTETAVPHISPQQICDFTVPFPRIEEQRKIAAILRTWDEAIDKLQALAIAQRKKHSQASNALLFSKESGRRKKVGKRLQQLADVTRELTQRNSGLNLGREFVMGVSNSKGIVPMREQSIGGDLSRYKVLPPRAFAYNPMRINVGSIAMSRLDSCVLVSPDYVLFQCVDGRLDPDYLDHLCNTHWWSHHINAGGSGSVRMRTYYDDLAALRLVLPDFEEQKKISLYLNAARRENDLIVDQINALQRQKRGLMQKLLTGEWRVKRFGDKESE